MTMPALRFSTGACSGDGRAARTSRALLRRGCRAPDGPRDRPPIPRSAQPRSGRAGADVPRRALRQGQQHHPGAGGRDRAGASVRASARAPAARTACRDAGGARCRTARPAPCSGRCSRRIAEPGPWKRPAPSVRVAGCKPWRAEAARERRRRHDGLPAVPGSGRCGGLAGRVAGARPARTWSPTRRLAPDRSDTGHRGDLPASRSDAARSGKVRAGAGARKKG